jgi:hypothetical protein
MRRHIALARIGFLRPQPPLADLRIGSTRHSRAAPSGSEAGEHHEAHRLAHV